MTGDHWVRITEIVGAVIVAVTVAYFWFRGGKG